MNKEGVVRFCLLLISFTVSFIHAGNKVENFDLLNFEQQLEEFENYSENNTEACQSDADCKYRGDCNEDEGTCECYEGVSGKKCEIIDECAQNPNFCGSDPDSMCAYYRKKNKAFCRCKTRSLRFDTETKTCVEQKTCKNYKQCLNAGQCLNKNYTTEDPRYCLCKFGTSGDYCDRVEECIGNPDYCGNESGVECRYNTFLERAYCQCKDQNQRFDWPLKKCVDRKKCDRNKDCGRFGECLNKCTTREQCLDYDITEEKNSCHCLEGTSGERCEVIDDCFNKVVDCGPSEAVTCDYYYNVGLTAFAFCKCKDPSLTLDSYDKECKECNCGKGSSSCSFEQGVKKCVCKPGHLELNGTCEKCDCGINSTDCKFDDSGKKICTCEPGYKVGNYSVCTPMCDEKHQCANGGSCLQDICMCLSGTSGPYCEKVFDCDNKLCGNNDDVNCRYDSHTQKAYCECDSNLHTFDSYDKSCKSCSCGYTLGLDWERCDFVLGKKVCQCSQRYAYNSKEDKCSKCDCGRNFGTDWVKCEFVSGNQVCLCSQGYAYNPKAYKCSECNCGTKSKACSFNNKGEKVCHCEEGYVVNLGTCKECGCGINGVCSFNSFGKFSKCLCDSGFSENQGKCLFCDCGPKSTCLFRNKRKMCTCARGYRDYEGYCTDIDECLRDNSCPGPGTVCENTLGSYKCRCQLGYQGRSPTEADRKTLCEKIKEPEPNYTPWKIGYGLLSVGFLIIIAALVYVIYRMRINLKTSSTNLALWNRNQITSNP